MAYCSVCKAEISCPAHQGFGHQPLDQPSIPCAQICSIWVRAVDPKGAPVAGIAAAASGKSDVTGDSGFAKLENLPAGKNTVKLGLAEQAGATYKPLDPDSRDESLAKGDLKLITVTVEPRVTPVMKISEPLVAVGGKDATITLTTDLPYAGKGTFTCAQGPEHLQFTPALTGGKLEVPSVPGSGQTITVKALTASALDGIAFEWKIDPGVQKGKDATGTMTAMKARLDVYKKSGTKATADLVVHLQSPAGERRRAKADLTWAPQGVEGSLTLTNTDGRLAVYEVDTKGGAIKKVTMARGKSSATVYLEGVKVSAKKDDAELVLGVEDRCDKADAAKLTVVDTKLVLCDRRVDDNTDPLPLADDKKANPGRALYLQGPQRVSTRALLRVLKTPTDAPCDLVLKAAADHVKLWDVEIPNTKDWTDNTKGILHKAEKAIATPKTLAIADFPDPVKGFVAWAEGAKVTPTGTRSAFTLDVTDVEDASDTVAFTVGLAKIEIEVVRSDNGPLSQAVKIGIKETEKGSTSPVKDYTNAKIEHEVAPGSYLFELTPQSQEAAFKILRAVPDGSLEASLVVKEGAATPVKFQLEPAPQYAFFQFIGYEIETGKYMGLDVKADDEADARKDILGRCKIMTEAIDVAFPKANASADTMKVFVAPEFYFRGIQGAYPVGMLHEIIDELRKHTKDPKFKDWLFLYGSAIGLLKLSDNKALLDVTNVTTPAPPALSAWVVCATTPLPTHSICKWDGATTVACSPFTVTRSVGTVHEVKFNPTVPTLGPKDTLWLKDGSSFPPIFLPITASSLKGMKCIHGTFNGPAIPDATMLKQGGSTGFVCTASVNTGAKTCEIFADFPGAVAGADITMTDLGQTEIFNVVFVQKGGSGTPMNKDGSCALKDLLIYKEAVSSVDFEGPDYGTQDFYEKHRHVTKLSGAANRTRPTEGSTDVFGDNPNVVGQPRKSTKGTDTGVTTSEKTTSGLGGGAIFTVDGVDFGVDVCLDHANARLKKSGSTVHIHLIPSCGMSIDNANIAIVSKGFVFNVDGQDGASHTKLQCHTTVIGAPTATAFAGTNRVTFFQKDGKIYVYPREQKQW